jgi:CubicO group peptidase (beta-lactamase class C family)
MKRSRSILLIRKIIKYSLAFCLGIVVFLLLSRQPGFAADPPLQFPQFPILDRQPQQDITPTVPSESAPIAPGLGNRAEFIAFADTFFEREMPKSHVPGVAIAIVKDGDLFVTKGYGYADLKQKTPVDPDTTLFRVASLSKLFTATATMQLHERGLLNVNEDITPYLGQQVAINNPYAEPVTFARMMMHNDGTTKRLLGLAAPTASEIQPLGDYLSDHMPPIVWEPGELYSYSNHSIALLGYLVQQISGRPFNQYIEDNIFKPLNMTRSSFRQPLPPPLASDLATGYQWHKRKNGFQPVPFLYLNIAPAAALSATATDMAKFMQAHLSDDSGLLQPQTMQMMHATHFRAHPRLPGTGYGFRERLVNGMRTIGHLGSLRGYSSSLTLLPDRNVGIFIVSNSFSGIHEKFLKQFFDRYFPASETAATPTNPPLQLDRDRYVGTYRDLEYPRHTFAKLAAPFKEIRIEKGENNTLVVKRPNLLFLKNFKPLVLNPIEPLLFQRENSLDYAAFEADETGDIIYAYNPVFPKMGTYERVPWYEIIWTQLGVLGACIVVFLSAVYVSPLRPLWRAWQGKSSPLKRSHRAPWRLAGIVSLLNLIFIVGLPLVVWLNTPWKLVYGVPPAAIALLAIPLITLAGLLGILLYAVLAWSSAQWSWRDRLHYSLVAAAAIAFIGLASYWNLLGFKF